MKCMICKNGETFCGYATVTLERDAMTLIIKGVPAEVCSNCGEEYIDEKTTALLIQKAEEAARAGVLLDVRQYIAA